MEIYPDRKGTNDRIASEEEGLLDRFREDVAAEYNVMGHDDLRSQLRRGEVDWSDLYQRVLDVPNGKDHAGAYHLAVENLLNALLFTAGLTDPVHEQRINEGRKRIDIDYKNSARSGFFNWLHSTFNAPCAYVPVECKNYGKELANPEIDQLLGRFSLNRGRFGLLCHRGFGKPEVLMRRCQDAAAKKHEYVLTIDDDEMKSMVDLVLAGESLDLFFDPKFRELTS